MAEITVMLGEHDIQKAVAAYILEALGAISVTVSYHRV